MECCLSLPAIFGRPRAAAAFPFLALMPLAAAAQQATDVVTITATRTPVRAGQVVAEVTVIDRAAIERAQGQTLVQLLAAQPGLQLSSNGGAGKTSSVFIRGLESRHTLLLVDGVPVSSATVGTPSLDNLPLELIERIEIVRGPMTSLYGNGAMGGVIQLFTRRAVQGLGASAMVAAGTQRQGQGAAGVSFGNATFDAIASVQRSTTQGQSSTNAQVPFGQYNADNDGFQQNAASLKLGWQPARDWRVEWLSLASEGPTRIDDGAGADARAEMRNQVHLLSADGRISGAWSTRVSVSQSVDAYDTLSSASAFASLGAIETRQTRVAWENRVATPIGQALALLERTTQKVSRPGAPFDLSERDIDAASLGLNGQAGGHSWQGSLRHDHNSQFGGVTTGALGYGYAFTPAWRVLASAGTSHTLPSFNQLYYPSFGNPLLQPEKGRHAELGLQWTGDGQQARVAYYEHRYRSFITAGPQPINLPKARINGVTLSYGVQWRQFTLDASLDHTDPRNDTASSANFDKLLPRRAKDTARVAVSWHSGPLTLGTQVQARSHRFDDAANANRLGGFTTVDLDARWALRPDLALTLNLGNVADKQAQTALGYDQPGRSALLALRWTMK
jgi:vitamin B12 transporter